MKAPGTSVDRSGRWKGGERRHIVGSKRQRGRRRYDPFYVNATRDPTSRNNRDEALSQQELSRHVTSSAVRRGVRRL
jgi:hypothetical protein